MDEDRSWGCSDDDDREASRLETMPPLLTLMQVGLVAPGYQFSNGDSSPQSHIQPPANPERSERSKTPLIVGASPDGIICHIIPGVPRVRRRLATS